MAQTHNRALHKRTRNMAVYAETGTRPLVTDKKLSIKGAITNNGVTFAIISEHRETLQTQRQLLPLHALTLSFNDYHKDPNKLFHFMQSILHATD